MHAGKYFQFIFLPHLEYSFDPLPERERAPPSQSTAHMHEYFSWTGKVVFPYYKLLAHASLRCCALCINSRFELFITGGKWFAGSHLAGKDNWIKMRMGKNACFGKLFSVFSSISWLLWSREFGEEKYNFSFKGFDAVSPDFYCQPLSLSRTHFLFEQMLK